MLSFLLEAIIAPETPIALCPPCHPEDVPSTWSDVFLSLLKSIVSMVVIVFPLYKTFKAWESNRLKACRAMLAYWSAMTLLNAMKDVTDEVIGNYFPPTLHHLLVAALKLAPLVLGPDAIYQYTVRPFFEQHEEEMDAVIKRANVKAQEVKADLMEYRAELMHAAAPMMEKVEHAVSPTIEQVRGSLIDTTHRVEHALGLDKDRENEKAREHPTSPLTAEDAVKKDEELSLYADPSSLTGLRQRSKQPMSFTAASSTGAAAAVPETAEIERAKQNGVLVEKIVWGHGLSAKQDEYQRQLKQKDTTSTTASLTDGVPERRAQPALPPPNTPTVPVTQNVVLPATSSALPQVASPMGPPVLTAVPKASHPPLSAFPLPSAVSTTAPAASVTDTGKTTTTLLDSRSIPNVAFMDPNLQKEL